MIAADVKLGRDVRIYDYVNLYGCEIGDEAKIGTFVEIQKGAKIGRRVKVSSHTFICEGVTIEDEAFIGHGVIFTNDSTTHIFRSADRSSRAGFSAALVRSTPRATRPARPACRATGQRCPLGRAVPVAVRRGVGAGLAGRVRRRGVGAWLPVPVPVVVAVRRGVGARLTGRVRVARPRVGHCAAVSGDVTGAACRPGKVAEGHRLLLGGAVLLCVRPSVAQPVGGMAGRVGADRGRAVVRAGGRFVCGGRADRVMGELLDRSGQRTGEGGGSEATDAERRDGGGGSGPGGQKR